MAHPENPQQEINFSQKAARQVARRVLEPWFLPSENIHVTNGMQRAEELHQEGYGILALITHFSRRDPEQAMDTFMSSEVFKNTKITGPIAKHQTVRGMVPPVGRRMGVDMYPVVTPATIQKELDKGVPCDLRVGSGSLPYIRAATKALGSGEVVIMAPQITRRPTLEYQGEDGVNGLLRVAIKKTPNIGIHLMSFGIPGTEDYGERKGFNFFRSYDVYHGPTFTLSEALEKSSEHAAKNKLEIDGMGNIDRFVFDEFAKIVPPTYLP